MNIRQRKEIKAFARERCAGQPEGMKIILIYTVLTLGLALAATAVSYVLNQQIGKTGGLSNMGTRALLDTFAQMLPIIQSVIAVCLELGYMAAMLRIARGQYVSTRTLKLGFDRFWPLLRLTITRGLIFLGAGFASMYLGILVYLLTPLSDPAMAILEPLVTGMTVVPDPMVLLEGEVYGQLLTAMIPCFILCGILYALFGLPIWYQYRLAGYVLIDNPAMGAIRALRESRMLMRRNRFQLFRLDLSLWYYHGALTLASLVAYGDMLLAMLGITLPGGEWVSYFGFYILYLLCQGVIYYFLRNRVEVSYCLAYDSLRPKAPEGNGVVLGNIFQM